MSYVYKYKNGQMLDGLKSLTDIYNLTIPQQAFLLGVSEYQLSKFLSGRHTPGPEFCYRLGRLTAYLEPSMHDCSVTQYKLRSLLSDGKLPGLATYGY